MKFREWFIEKLIEKLKKDVEPECGHINLEAVSEEERQKLFKQFGEGDENLIRFLNTAYKSGIPSIFCCSGHGVQRCICRIKNHR